MRKPHHIFNKLKLFLNFIFFFVFVTTKIVASNPIVLTDQNSARLFSGNLVDLLEDPTHKLTLDDVTSELYKYNFVTGNEKEATSNEVITSTYWMRLNIVDSSLRDINWVIALYEFKIDYFEIYIPVNGRYTMQKSGTLYPFELKKFQHKNYIFNLPKFKGTPIVLYIKAKASKPVFLIGMIRSYEKLLAYATTEYFMLAIFYGIVLSMILYNLFLYTATFDSAYLFYVLYVISGGILALTKDGLGSQYLWPLQPNWNEFIHLLAAFMMVFWVLLYARQFLNTKTNELKFIDKGILILIGIRTIFFLCCIIYPSFASIIWIDILIFLFVYISGIISFFKGNKMARFYILAFTLFFLGFSIDLINKYHTISFNILVNYSFNIGSLCEMVFLSLSLADRIKMLTIEKQKAQGEMIIQFTENEKLKDLVNQELENKVYARTKALEDKNKELDAFVYRSSHDIKGPLKSIIGLTSIGLLDTQDSVSKKYFEHILKSSKRLDYVVDHLLGVMEIKESKLIVSKIYLDDVISNVISLLEDMPELKFVKIFKSIVQKDAFHTDENILKTILKDIISIVVKHRDIQKSESHVNINIIVEKATSKIEIIGNGKVIKEEFKEGFFDVYRSLGENSKSDELGFYLLKVYVEKINGSIKFESVPGSGSKFFIELKSIQI